MPNIVSTGLVKTLLLGSNLFAGDYAVVLDSACICFIHFGNPLLIMASHYVDRQ